MSISLSVSTRAGKILWKDPLAPVLEVKGWLPLAWKLNRKGRLLGGPQYSVHLDSYFQYSDPAFNCACYSLVYRPSILPFPEGKENPDTVLPVSELCVCGGWSKVGVVYRLN